MNANIETYQFQAESNQLLNLMIHSVYSNKEIFLRELISNASDAIDKLRLLSITNPEIIPAGEKFEIRIDVDKEKRILSVSDNGIGMNKEDLINHIGTIAKSGTTEFIKKLKESGNLENPELIGQFGVGFYSVFMVADKVTIITKKAGETQAYKWESTGNNTYTIEPAEREKQGTTVILNLKPVDEDNGILDFTQDYIISRIVKQYSDFISYPIIMKQEKEEYERDEKGEIKKDGKKIKKIEDVTLNSMKPLWMKNEKETTKEECYEFYKHISHDWSEPLKYVFYKAEGNIEFNSILFIPSRAPFDFYYQGYKSGLHLYVKKVLIMENFEDLLPKYLRFVKGVVDSPDLSLNISREMLQKDKNINIIKKNLTKKVIDTLQDMFNNDRDNYLKFWKEFGLAIKEGITSDHENREKLSNLLLFESTYSEDKLTSLDEYVNRMPNSQNEIYYITGESRKQLEDSPYLEAIKEKKYEVLFMTDPIDEIVVQYLTEYKGKKLKSISKGDINLDKDNKIKDKEKEYKDLLEYIEKKLEDHIKKVKLSTRLVSSPACLISDEYDFSPHIEKLLNREKLGNITTKRILELNPNHQIITKLFDKFKENKNDPIIDDYIELLFGYALIGAGSTPVNINKFNKLMIQLMEKGL